MLKMFVSPPPQRNKFSLSIRISKQNDWNFDFFGMIVTAVKIQGN